MSDKPPDKPFYQPLIETIKDIIMPDKEERPEPVSVRQHREHRQQAAPEASPTPQAAPGPPVHSPPPPPSGQHPPQNPQLSEKDEAKAREERQIRQRLVRSKAFRSRGWRI